MSKEPLTLLQAAKNVVWKLQRKETSDLNKFDYAKIDINDVVIRDLQDALANVETLNRRLLKALDTEGKGE